jgi:hypothetical protein
VYSRKLVVPLQVNRCYIFLGNFHDIIILFGVKRQCTLVCFWCIKMRTLLLCLEEQNLLQTISFCSVDTENSLPSYSMFLYWFIVNKAVLFLIIFVKNGCRCCLKSSTMSLSTLTTEDFFEREGTLSYHSSGTKTYSSLRLIFSV